MSEPVSNQSSLVGRIVDGRYRLEERLCAGPQVQGATYRARHVEHQRVVALKLLHERPGGSSARRASFEWEASTLSGLAHPNIATLVDYGVYEGQAWLAVEWLEGETLAARLQRGALSLTAALAIVRQLLAALASAHGARLIHRNLKPDNIFLERSPTQSRERVKLLDFTPLLCASACAGSPYAPPELAAGQTLDARGDVFAVGLTLIATLNTAAFEAPEEADAGSQRPSVAARGRALPGVDATLLTWIRRASSPHKPLRFADAADALRELIDLLPRDLLSPPARAEAANRTAAMAGSRASQPIARPFLVAPPPPSGPPRVRTFTVPPPPPPPESSPAEVEKPSLSQLLQRASANEPATASDAELQPEAEARSDSRRGTLRPIESRILAAASEPRRLQLMAAAVFGVFLMSGLVILLQPGARGRGNTRTAASESAPRAERETVATVRSLETASAKPPAPAAPVKQQPLAAKAPTAAVVAPAVVAPPPQPQSPAKVVTPRPDARGLAIIARPGRPAVRDPWQDAAPPELKRAHMLSLNGAPGDEARIKALREYNRDHPNDVRGYLVIGQFYLNRLWRTDCVEEWSTALERDPTARGAPEVLPALIAMIEQGKAPILAERLIAKAYGSEALDPIDLAFEDVKNPTNAARLHALRLRISEGKVR